MRAILICTGSSPQLEPIINYRPSPLLNVADKPILFHIIESLIPQGYQQLDLILNHLPEQIEEELQEGGRWGVKIHYHLVKDPYHPFKILLPLVNRYGGDPFLLGQGDNLPIKLQKPNSDLESPLFFNEASGKWSGWGYFPSRSLEEVPHHAHIDQLPELVQPHQTQSISQFLSTRSFQEIMESNRTLLQRGFSEVILPSTAKNVEPGVWLSRAVVIEPGVEIVPPVYIGEKTHIKSGARIGPNVILEKNTLIDEDSHIEHSVVCQRSYVGETLEIKDCIVDRNCLINLSHQTQLCIRDTHILSDATPPAIHHYFFELFQRVTALFLFTALSPIYLYLKCFCESKEREIISVPTDADPAEWKSFSLSSFVPKNSFQHFFSHLPYLIQVIKGHMQFVGNPPRTLEEIKKLPQDWQHLYLNSKIGIIHLCDIHHTSHSDDDEYAAETYYTTHWTPWFDIKLIGKWAMKLFSRKNNGPRRDRTVWDPDQFS